MKKGFEITIVGTKGPKPAIHTGLLYSIQRSATDKRINLFIKELQGTLSWWKRDSKILKIRRVSYSDYYTK